MSSEFTILHAFIFFPIVPPPMATAVNSPVSGEIGMSAILQCSIALPNGISNTELSDTSYYIEWIYNGAPVDQSTVAINMNAQYIVNTVSLDMVGSYTCQASIIYTGDQTDYVTNSSDVSNTVILQTTS